MKLGTTHKSQSQYPPHSPRQRRISRCLGSGTVRARLGPLLGGARTGAADRLWLRRGLARGAADRRAAASTGASHRFG
jgi:hypothetical protein